MNHDDLIRQAAAWIKRHAHHGKGIEIAQALEEAAKPLFTLQAEPVKKRKPLADPRHKQFIERWCSHHYGSYMVTVRDGVTLKQFLIQNPLVKVDELIGILQSLHATKLTRFYCQRLASIHGFLTNLNELKQIVEKDEFQGSVL